MGSEISNKSPLLEDLPKGWSVKKLNFLCSKIGTGATPRGGQKVYLSNRAQYALIRSQNVYDRYFDNTGLAFIDDKAADKLKNAEVLSEDVLLNITGDGITFARSCIVPDRVLPACVNQHVAIIRTKAAQCIPGYLLALLTHPTMKEYIESFNAGGSRRAITKGHIEAFEVLLPPLPEQKAIAHIQGSLDDKIELNRRMNATLEGMAQALFKSWFVDFDPVIDNALVAGNPIPEELAERAEVRRKALADGTANREAARQFPAAFQLSEEMGWIPEGWEVKDFGEVSECLDRKRIPLSKKQREEKKPGNIPYYGATSIMDYINGSLFEDTYLLIGEDGSVLKEDGSPFVQYIWGKSWVNNHAHVLQGASGISTEHLMLFMLSQNVTPYVTGAVQLKINQKNMNSIPFLKAEDKTNQYFTDCISPLYERLKLLTEENRTLTNLRDTLLPKLISGELRIPDAEKLTEAALS